ncbi:MAG: thiamine pyrophosphate-dependent enzyme [Cyanobium sp.]
MVALGGADRPLQPPQPLPLAGEPQDTLSSDLFYPRLQRFLSANDLLVVDTGSCLLRTNPLRLPAGVALERQTLWGSIGWGTPAALGCALAEPQRRVVLLTGDGAHQLTAQELGVMGACGIAPVVIVLNNGLYGIEAVISETGHAYNVIPSWQYSRLPEVLGCQGWWSGRVTRLAELEQALAASQRHPGGALLEEVLPAEESQPLPEPVIERLHQTHTP